MGRARFKVTANVRCPLCERRHVIANYFHFRKSAVNWYRWAKGNYHLCPECEDKQRWTKRRREQA